MNLVSLTHASVHFHIAFRANYLILFKFSRSSFVHISANKSDVQTQLNLALAWNRSDMARKEIFNVENRAAWQVS